MLVTECFLGLAAEVIAFNLSAIVKNVPNLVISKSKNLRNFPWRKFMTKMTQR